MGEPAHVLVAAVLYDVVEDTAVTIDQIEEQFGSEVARLVAAVSFDSNIPDPPEQYIEMFNRTVAAGRDALVIKAADVLDNSTYYGDLDDVANKVLRGKATYLVGFCEKHISEHQITELLKERFIFE